MATSEKIDVIQSELTNEACLEKRSTDDTLHNDEGMRVLANYDGETTWDEKEEKLLKRKIDYRLLPILCATYGLQYYDKGMLSQAALFGLRKDLELEVGNRYSFCSSIFYLGFIVGAYSAILLAQRFPIERVAAAVVFLWGICLTCTAACQNWQSIYVQRFFLGFLESGISPMFMMVVGQFYKKDEQALRMGAWYCSTGYISVVSPLINYGLGHITGSLSPWRYMYIVAGVITMLWSVVILFFMPPDPIRFRGLNPRERYIAVARLRTNNSGVRNTHFKTGQAIELLCDVKFWLMFSIAFLMLIANGPVSTFVPSIIHSFGFNTLNAIRRNHHATGGLLFGAYILASNSAGYAVMMGLQLANTAGYTKRSLASSGIFVGYCFGNFVGPLVFKTSDAPRYPSGFIVVFATACVAVLLIIAYRAICVWENKRRDESGTAEGFEHAYEDDFTDRTNKQFRFQNKTRLKAAFGPELFPGLMLLGLRLFDGER